MASIRPTLRRAAWLAAVIACAPSQAQTTNWNVANGDWFTANNWNPVGVPNANSVVRVHNSGVCNITANLADAQAKTLYVGYDDAGKLVQTDKNLSVSGDVFIGLTARGPGTYEINNSLLQAQNMTIALERFGTDDPARGSIMLTGDNPRLELLGEMDFTPGGEGTITQNAGTLSVSGRFRFAHFGGSTAHYLLNGGTAAVSIMEIGKEQGAYGFLGIGTPAIMRVGTRIDLGLSGGNALLHNVGILRDSNGGTSTTAVVNVLGQLSRLMGNGIYDLRVNYASNASFGTANDQRVSVMFHRNQLTRGAAHSITAGLTAANVAATGDAPGVATEKLTALSNAFLGGSRFTVSFGDATIADIAYSAGTASGTNRATISVPYNPAAVAGTSAVGTANIASRVRLWQIGQKVAVLNGATYSTLGDKPGEIRNITASVDAATKTVTGRSQNVGGDYSLGVQGVAVTPVHQDPGIAALHAAPYNLSGNGVVMGQLEPEVPYLTHGCFDDWSQANPANLRASISGTVPGDEVAKGHATRVASIMIGYDPLGLQVDAQSRFEPADKRYNNGVGFTGAAPKATLTSRSLNEPGTDTANFEALVGVPGMKIINMSYGVQPGTLSIGTAVDDEFVRAIDRLIEVNGLIVTKSAGNRGKYESLTNPAAIYNGIVVGNAEIDFAADSSYPRDFNVGRARNAKSSSRGPTNDNARAKPDIAAQGIGNLSAFAMEQLEAAGSIYDPTYPVAGNRGLYSTRTRNARPGEMPFGLPAEEPIEGTSFAAPTVAGVAALLVQDARSRADANAEHPLVIKSVLQTSADKNATWEKGRRNVAADNTPSVPLSYDWGAGLLDPVGAVNLERKGINGSFDNVTADGWALRTLAFDAATGATGPTGALPGDAFTLKNVVANAPLTLTLNWYSHADNTAVPPRTTRNVDLLLHSFDPMTMTWRPLADARGSSISTIDNLEHIWFDSLPAGGDLLVQVKPVGFGGGVNELYALSWEGVFKGNPAGPAIWNPPDGSGSGAWSAGANWTSGAVPNGAGAVAIVNFLANSGQLYLDADVRLGQLLLSDPQIAEITSVGGTHTITFDGPALIRTTDFPREFPTGPRYFGTAIGRGANPVTLAGSDGLTISGGPVAFRTPHAYTGTTTIRDGGRLTVMEGAGNNAFGATGGGSIILDRGQIWIETNSITIDRPVVIGPGGGNLSLGMTPGGFTNQVHTFSGVISGSGSLLVDGEWGGRGSFTAANTHTGPVHFSIGTHTIIGDGAFASSSSIRTSGTLVLAQGNANTNVDRIGDSTPVILSGALRLQGNATPYSETTGPLTLTGGTSAIVIVPGAGGTRLNAGTLTRTQRGAVEIRALGLGFAPGPNVGNVFLSNGTALLKNGIIPFAFGSAADPVTVGVESASTTLLTYGANGVTPVTAFADNINTSTADDNVLITDGGQTATAARDANALVLRASQKYQSDTPIKLEGNSVALKSGVILSAWAGALANGNTNTGPGNVINSDINAGTNELVLLTPSALTTNGKISGTGGLSKRGARTWFANNTDSNYSGPTRLTGFNRFKGDIAPAANSAYGNDVSPIVLDLNNRLQDISQLIGNTLPTTILGVSFGPDAGQGPTALSRGLYLADNGSRSRVSAFIRNFSSGTFTIAGPITIEAGAEMRIQSLTGSNEPFDVIGTIMGNGILTLDPAPATLNVALRAPNTFTGGVNHRGGILTIGTSSTADPDGSVLDGPLGTGTYFATSSLDSIIQTDAVRTIHNTLVIVKDPVGTTGFAKFSIGGTSPIRFAGQIMLDRGLIDVVAANSATFSGNVSHGSLFKTGAGTLHLSGQNTLHGQINAGNANSPGGMIVLRSPGAVGSNIGVTAANHGENAIGVTGGITLVNETMVIRGEGVGALGGLRNLSGDNRWTGPVRIQQQNDGANALTTKGTIGVDNNSLTIESAIATLPTHSGGGPANALGVRKVGPGVLNVGSETFTATRSGGQTSNFQAAIVASGSLDIAEGKLALLPRGTGVVTGPRSIIHVGALAIAGGPARPAAAVGETRGADMFNALRATGELPRIQGPSAMDSTDSSDSLSSSRLDPGMVYTAGRARPTPMLSSVINPHETGGESLAPTAVLDLANNAMVVDYPAGFSPLADIRSYVTTGYAAGAWTGNGINSSVAALAGNFGRFALGYAEASDVLTFAGAPPDALFHGDVVDQTAVLVMYTRYGDADLDGNVNLGDFARVAANFNTPGLWSQGNFNFDNAVDIGDFAMLAANFNQTAPGEMPRSGVPEPGMAVAALAFVAGMRWRLARRE